MQRQLFFFFFFIPNFWLNLDRLPFMKSVVLYIQLKIAHALQKQELKRGRTQGQKVAIFIFQLKYFIRKRGNLTKKIFL